MQRDSLSRITGYGHPDQVTIANDTIGWIEFDPACTRQIYLTPRMRRPAAQRCRAIATRDIYLACDEARR